MNYFIRNFKAQDQNDIMKLWSDNDWNFPKYQNNVMINIDPNGIKVAQLVDSDEVLGTCNGVIHDKDFGSIGGFVVKSGSHGSGIGSTLWKSAMNNIGNQRNITLFSGIHMENKYSDKWNFKIIANKKSLRFEGKPDLDKLVKEINGISIENIKPSNIGPVIEYDKSVCNRLNRSLMIEEYSKCPETVCLLAFDQKFKKVVGYCILTVTNFNSAIFSPLYADNQLIAELLINKSCHSLLELSSKGLCIKCFDSNPEGLEIANKLGLKRNFVLSLLSNKNLIESNDRKIFSITGPSFYPF